MGKNVVAFVLLSLILPISAVAGELSYKDRVEFEKSFVRSCLKGFEKEDYGFEDWQKKEFCKCSAMFTGDMLTYDDIRAFVKKKSYPKSLLDKRDKASTRCIEELMKTWGYPQQ